MNDYTPTSCPVPGCGRSGFRNRAGFHSHLASCRRRYEAEKKKAGRVTTDQCPECRQDLTGPEIPEGALEHYPRGSTHYTRVLVHETMAFNVLTQRHEKLTLWRCPFCGHEEGDYAAFAVRIRPLGGAAAGGQQ